MGNLPTAKKRPGERVARFSTLDKPPPPASYVEPMKNNHGKKSVSQSALTCLFVVLTFAVCNPSAQANTTIWIVSSGDWFSAANWNNGVPDINSDAFINNGGKATIAQPAVARSLTLGSAPGDSGAVSVDGANGGRLALAPSNSPEDPAPAPAQGAIYVGYGGSGTLSIASGGTVASALGYIATLKGAGQIVDSNGAVTVDGLGSSWTIGNRNSRLFIGGTNNATTEGGTALLNVTNGATVTVNNPPPMALNSTAISVGISGTLTGDGTITANGTNYLNMLMAVKGTLAPSSELKLVSNVALDLNSTTVCNVTPEQTDIANVALQATLGGHLLVIMDGTFLPTGMTRFTLLHADGSLYPNQFFQSISIKYPVGQGFEPKITYDFVGKNVFLDLIFTQ